MSKGVELIGVMCYSINMKDNGAKKTNNKKISKTGKIVLLVLLVLLLLAVIAAAVLIYLNEFTLEIELSGEKEITLEYGEEYEEQGAKAHFSGSIFKNRNTECEVEITNNVNVEKLGSYTVEYCSEYTLSHFLGSKTFTQKAKRTVNVVDTTLPSIELKEVEGHYTLPGHPYEEEGYSAKDNYDGDITASVTFEEREGKVYYSVADSSGNKYEAVREIFYDDPIPPELKLLGDGDIVIAEGGSFADPGYLCVDNIDGDITDKVIVSGSVNTAKAGNYTLNYTVSDNYKNTVTLTRPITVRKRVEVPEKEEGKEHEVLHTEPLNPNGKVIYLTFDDGPSQHTARLLDVLKKYDIKATFFVVNAGNLNILTRMKAEGHTVAMHTSSHVYERIYSSDEAYLNDLSTIENRIKEVIGEAPKILRFPGGSSNTVSKRYNEGVMTRVTAKVKDMGYRYYDWNVDSDDAGKTRTTEGVYNNVTSLVPKNQYSVVLQHDTKGYSVDAVEKIIIWGLENGYTFKVLSENSPVCEQSVNN